MFYQLAILLFPKYPNYSFNGTMLLPFANNTQTFYFTNDNTTGQQYYEYYNNSYAICDSYLTNNTFAFFMYTNQTSYMCMGQGGAIVQIIPNLDNFTYMNQTVVDGNLLDHYRFQSFYSPAGGFNENQTYLSNVSYQQDFYVWPLNQTPYRWEINGWGPQLYALTDYYIINYYNFVAEANTKVLTPSQQCQNVTPATIKKHNHPLAKLNLHAHATQKHMSETYKQNLAKIMKINANPKNTYSVAPNHFMHHTRDMLRQLFRPKTQTSDNLSLPTLELPINASWVTRRHMDWRIKGVIGFVKDQVDCGGCWTFATTGCLEGRVNIHRLAQNKSNPLIRLSEQSIIDCYWSSNETNPNEQSQGCNGGSPDMALWWFANTSSGFALQVNYPFMAQNDYCKKDLMNYTDYVVTNAWRIPQFDVNQTKQALQDGPVSLAVTTSDGFLYYSGGILNDPACSPAYQDLDHGVVLVGWGTDDQYGEYWIVRNSWSSRWGQDGYIYIQIEGNVCGVTTDAVYGVVAPRAAQGDIKGGK